LRQTLISSVVHGETIWDKFDLNMMTFKQNLYIKYCSLIKSIQLDNLPHYPIVWNYVYNQKLKILYKIGWMSKIEYYRLNVWNAWNLFKSRIIIYNYGGGLRSLFHLLIIHFIFEGPFFELQKSLFEVKQTNALWTKESL